MCFLEFSFFICCMLALGTIILGIRKVFESRDRWVRNRNPPRRKKRLFLTVLDCQKCPSWWLKGGIYSDYIYIWSYCLHCRIEIHLYSLTVRWHPLHENQVGIRGCSGLRKLQWVPCGMPSYRAVGGPKTCHSCMSQSPLNSKMAYPCKKQQCVYMPICVYMEIFVYKCICKCICICICKCICIWKNMSGWLIFWYFCMWYVWMLKNMVIVLLADHLSFSPMKELHAVTPKIDSSTMIFLQIFQLSQLLKIIICL